MPTTKREWNATVAYGETVTACRWCGTAVYLAANSSGPMVGGTGPALNEHWRHIEANERYCKNGNGALAEPYDGTGPIAGMLREIRDAKSASK